MLTITPEYFHSPSGQWIECDWDPKSKTRDEGLAAGIHELIVSAGKSYGASPEALLFGTVNPLPNLEPTWNMAPTRDAPVVRMAKDGQRHLDALKWGLIPYTSSY
jgi:hypothetical protein